MVEPSYILWKCTYTLECDEPEMEGIKDTSEFLVDKFVCANSKIVGKGENFTLKGTIRKNGQFAFKYTDTDCG